MDNTFICNKVAGLSNRFETCNTELKKRYIAKNITLFNTLISSMLNSKGTFGTGYPFYALEKNFKGTLPVIHEQIRYNNQLKQEGEQSNHIIWPCYECLRDNGDEMPDLKKVCNSCKKIEPSLKPRKIINRLPDIDMWVVCNECNIQAAADELISLFEENNIQPSDINPIQTIEDISDIVNDLENDTMPKKLLPIDAHIIGYSSLFSLLKLVTAILKFSSETDTIPYLPIHPLSYRKVWQYDDVAYNFIHDFLSSFTEFNFDPELEKLLLETRSFVANQYSKEQLYDYLIMTGPKSVKERHKTSLLKDRFEERIHSWKN